MRIITINQKHSIQLKNTINYSVENLPAWLSWNPSTQSISGKTNKAGQYAIDIIAYSKTDTVHQHFMLTVL